MKLGFDAKRYFHNQTGLGNYSRDLIRILNTFYKDCKLNLYNTKPSVKGNRAPDYAKEILPKGFWSKWSGIWRQGPVVKQIEEENIEIYHGLTGELPFGIAKLPIKKIVTIHDLIFIRYPHLYSYFDRKIHFYKFKHAAKVADLVIAISEQTKRDIVEFLKIDPHKIKVIYQGCHDTFKATASQSFKEEVKQKFALPESFLLNVGTIEERKNLLTLVKAIEKSDVNLVVVGGKTPYYQKVMQYIEQKQLTSRVFFLSGVSMKELAAIYQMAHIFVYPSLFEGFGIPIIEALFSKTPVISSTGSCFAEAGGPDAVYVNPKDSQSLYLAIQSLLNNAKQREIQAEKGYQYAQRFTDENIANALVSVYRDVYKSKR